MNAALIPIQRAIIGYRLDEYGDWIAELACGHTQHVRHNPPWVVRTWVTTEQGRQAHLWKMLSCRECAQLAVQKKSPTINRQVV